MRRQKTSNKLLQDFNHQGRMDCIHLFSIILRII